MVIALSSLWGATFIFAGAALQGFSFLTLALCRVLISSLFIWGVVLVSGVRFPWYQPKVVGWILLLSLTGNVLPFAFIFWGQTKVPGSLAAILNATAPLFTLFFAHLLTQDEKLSPRKVVGALVGLSGVVVIIGPDALGHIGESVIAQLSCIVGSAFYALSNVLARRVRQVPFLLLAALQLSGSCMMLGPVVLIAEPPWEATAPGLAPLLALAALAILSTGIAYILYFRIVATAGATNLSLVAFLAPAWAILLGNLLLNEVPQPQHLAGLAVIIVGLAIVDGRLARQFTRMMRRA